MKRNTFSICPKKFRVRYKKLSNVWACFPYKNDEKTHFSAFKQKNKLATPQVMHGKSLKYKNKHFFYLPEKISDSL